MSSPEILNVGTELPIRTQRGTDFVLQIDFTPYDITGAVLTVEFFGSGPLPVAEVEPMAAETEDGPQYIAILLVRKESVALVKSTCRYLVKLLDKVGITTAVLRGTFAVTD